MKVERDERKIDRNYRIDVKEPDYPQYGGLIERRIEEPRDRGLR
jgi:hypothetical protein